MPDPYVEVIRDFNRNRVLYVVVGVSGINYYAKDARQLILTADYDVLLKPELANVMDAIKVMKKLGFVLTTKEGRLGRITKKSVGRIVSSGLTVVCENHHGNMVELCLQVSGFSFQQLSQNAREFRAGRTHITVGLLRDLLHSKEIANRPKDRLFLEKYRAMLTEED